MSDRFLIAPFKSGLIKNLPVWQTTEESFYELKNVYISKGVIKKRFGSKYIGSETSSLSGQLNSRLRIYLGDTDVNGNIASTGFPIPAGAVFKAGQMFSVGDDIFTVPTTGTPVIMLRSSGATDCTFDTTSGVYSIVNSEHEKACYFYPSEPVLGLTMYESGTINDSPAIAFDTRFAYKFIGSSWVRSGTHIYSGDNTNYVWSTNFEGDSQKDTALFSTNFYANEINSDKIHYTQDTVSWTEFKRKIRTSGTADENIIVTAKIIQPFHARLLLFHTYEYEDSGGGFVYNHYRNRVRFSAIKNPLGTNAWLEPGQIGYVGGNFIDAPTEEEIMSVQYVRDKLIVYFERSTYELVYTFNDALPFLWRKISSDLGASAEFSAIPSSDSCVAIGNTGVHACNGSTVKRIDSKIPDEIFKFLSSSNALKRICGIKDYYDELYYWSIPGQVEDDDNSYPDSILLYNYENDSWSILDDSITAFGYFEQNIETVWQDDYQTWEDDDSTWDEPFELPNKRQIIAGNQQGFIFRLNNDTNTNASVLQISKIDNYDFTVVDNNLAIGDYVKVNNSIAGDDSFDKIYKVYDVDGDTIQLSEKIGYLDIPVTLDNYNGGATLERISRISMKTSAMNPYISSGSGVSVDKVIFGVAKTELGKITVSYIPSQSSIDPIADGKTTDSNLGTFELETYPYDLVPLEKTQNLLWHSVYLNSQGDSISLYIYYSAEQMTNYSIISSSLEIQGMIIVTNKTQLLG